MRSFLGYVFAATAIVWPIVVIVWARRVRRLGEKIVPRSTFVQALFMLFGSSILFGAAWLLFR
jgi:hypothetical protein